MPDSRPPSTDEGTDGTGADGARDDATGGTGERTSTSSVESTDELRRQVEETYDFDNFGPKEMARMSLDEWEAAFDADSWITGEELLERVEADLRNRIAARDVFARIERVEQGLLAYSDEGYALVGPDGSVEGQGTVLRDVKPTVALCSMDDYDIEDPPEGELLPDPSEVPEGGGELGNRMLQVIAATQFLTGIGLFVAWIVLPVETIFAPVMGVAFVLFSLLLFLQVANARLSDRFRAEEYRNRLRAVGLGSDERPAFLPEEYDIGADAAGTSPETDDRVRSSTRRAPSSVERSTDDREDDSNPSA